MARNDTRLVYSTETGRMCPDCKKPMADCSCKKRKTQISADNKIDGIIRIRRETKGRKGKTVTTISGFDMQADQIERLSSKLKVHCGTGGSVKGGIIVIQGDHREAIKAELEKQGFKTKLTGG